MRPCMHGLSWLMQALAPIRHDNPLSHSRMLLHLLLRQTDVQFQQLWHRLWAPGLHVYS